MNYVIVKNNSTNEFWHNYTYRWFTQSQGLSRYLHLTGGSNSLTGKLYWAARDLEDSPAGNHHFFLIVFNDKYSCQRICREFDIEYKSEKKGNITTYFATVCGNGSNGLSSDSKLTCHFNQKSDIKSVREYIDPDQHVYTFKPDFDLERHIISPLAGWNEEFLIKSVIRAAQNYEAKGLNVPSYDLADQNCATWANSLLRFLGYSKSYRTEKGEFDGVDWGEENTISSHYFRR